MKTGWPGIASRPACFLWIALWLAGCSSPHIRFDRQAMGLGLERIELTEQGLPLVVYRHPDLDGRRGAIHVYLTGDGTPYIRRGLAAADPTPRQPLVPELIKLDPAPVLILGRPCFHGSSSMAGCATTLWTSARYGEHVVSSMASALEASVPKGRDVVLIGHSGGGALAVLLARRNPRVRAMVTLAGNLDHQVWTRRHRYTPLGGSLNPVDGMALPSNLIQRHYAGKQDTEVPPDIIDSAARRLGGRAVALPDVGHRGGWVRAWPGILAELEAALSDPAEAGGPISARAARPDARVVRMPD